MKFQDYIFSRLGESFLWIEGINNSVDCAIMQVAGRVPRSDLEKEIKRLVPMKSLMGPEGTTDVYIWLSDQPDADPDYEIRKVR